MSSNYQKRFLFFSKINKQSEINNIENILKKKEKKLKKMKNPTELNDLYLFIYLFMKRIFVFTIYLFDLIFHYKYSAFFLIIKVYCIFSCRHFKI